MGSVKHYSLKVGLSSAGRLYSCRSVLVNQKNCRLWVNVQRRYVTNWWNTVAKHKLFDVNGKIKKKSRLHSTKYVLLPCVASRNAECLWLCMSEHVYWCQFSWLHIVMMNKNSCSFTIISEPAYVLAALLNHLLFFLSLFSYFTKETSIWQWINDMK